MTASQMGCFQRSNWGLSLLAYQHHHVLNRPSDAYMLAT
jgi:hypothetical protein